MASVCGGCLAMMDARAAEDHVAGSRWASSRKATVSRCCRTFSATRITSATWTSSAGTENGITALQMDIKIQGITKEIMHVALNRRARAGSTSSVHEECAVVARQEISTFARASSR